MSYSKVQIYNIALNNLGVSATIQNTAQADVKTVVLNNYYNVALEQVLKDFDWNFANTYKSLTPTVNECLNPRYAHEYDYPNDCIVARKIVDESGEENNIDFEISSDASGQRVINTNVSPATLKYTRLVNKEVFFTPEFVMALSWYLAFLAAEAITGQANKKSNAFSIYRNMIGTALASNANEGYENIDKDALWIEAR